MKKDYAKPKVICQELRPEELVCACDIVNTDFNESMQCGYTLENFPLTVFAQGWASCMTSDFSDLYCYHNGQVLLFGS